MSTHVLSKIKVYGKSEDLEEFVNELVTDNEDCCGNMICYYFDKYFDELSKISNGDEDIIKIAHWYEEGNKDSLMKVYGEPIEIKSDHIAFSLGTLSVPPYQILYILIKKYKKLKISISSYRGSDNDVYNWQYILEGENGQITKDEYRDHDSIYWKDDLEFMFEYKEDALNGSFTLTSADVYNKSKRQLNKYNEDIDNYKYYEVIPWERDWSIMIEQIKDYRNDNIKISKGKIFNNKEITETEAKEMLEFIYNDESFCREVF